jgi:hypothetical protein
LTTRIGRFKLLVLGSLILTACLAGGGDNIFEHSTSTKSACDRPGNLIVNCGFDRDLEDWQFLPGSGVVHQAADGSSKTGCAEAVSMIAGAEWVASLSQCVVFPSAATHELGASIRVVTGSPDNCDIRFGGKSNCNPGSVGGAFFVVTFSPVDSWSQSPRFVTDLSTAWDAAVVYLYCSGTTPFTVRFDDVFLGQQ